MKIVHLTSVHPRFDTRIFHKECRSLAARGHEVTLVVADGQGDAFVGDVAIRDVGASRGRAARLLSAARRVTGAARELEPNLCHLHDPELLPGGLRLKREGTRVIFDAHEDVPQDILSKPYLPPRLRKPLSVLAGSIERSICRRLDGVVAATPFIRDKFLAMGVRSIDVNNYPVPDEFLSATGQWDEKDRAVCYVGGISTVRGAAQMVAALGLVRTEARLTLAGAFQEKGLQETLERQEGWSRVDAEGFLDRQGVRRVLERSRAGLVTLHPTIAYRVALPVKLFEYMAAGLPVIASDIPLWQEIVETSGCGLCVDPFDPAAIAEAIDRLLASPDLAMRMGQNGRNAVLARYNWASEEKKLVEFYEDTASGRSETGVRRQDGSGKR